MSAQHTITLHTRDGGEVSFTADEASDLIAAACSVGLTLPAICRSGSCGACHGHCNSGEYKMASHSSGALSEADATAGGILLCRTHAQSDMHIEIDSDLAHIQAGPAAERTAEIDTIEDMGGEVRRLVLRIVPDESGDLGPTFEPGQYMELATPAGLKRAYSIANAPNWEGLLEFYIRLQPNGQFSDWLRNEAKVGQTLSIVGPEGSFVLKAGSLAPRRFVAGGTGVAPMFSMLRQMAEFGESNPSALYFGVTRQSDLFGLAQLDELKAQLPNLKVVVCVWQPEADWQGFAGSPADAFKQDLAADMAGGLRPEVYLCGPPGLVDATETAAQELGLPHNMIFSERFSV